MKIIFFGSSEFSLPSLSACLSSAHEVALVITTPDQKRGRGLKFLPNPVKSYCAAKAVPCESPESLKNQDILNRVIKLQPDLYVVASYGKIIPSSWLSIPTKTALNIHPSLLPRHRGASPINWPILMDEKETGLSIAEVTNKLDAGDIFFQQKILLSSAVTSEELAEQLSLLAAEALHRIFQNVETGSLTRIPQDESRSTYARKLAKNDGAFSWDEPADKIHNKIRGLLPWPTAFFMHQGNIIQALQSQIFEQANNSASAGTLLEICKDGKATIQCGAGALNIKKVKPAGKNAMAAADYFRGKRINPGSKLLSQ